MGPLPALILVRLGGPEPDLGALVAAALRGWDLIWPGCWIKETSADLSPAA